jgi:hypothetical protein
MAQHIEMHFALVVRYNLLMVGPRAVIKPRQNLTTRVFAHASQPLPQRVDKATLCSSYHFLRLQTASEGVDDTIESDLCFCR